jgi:hypothetical protein
MLIASGLLALVIGAAFAVLLVSVADLRTQERLTTRSQEVLVTANQLERLVLDWRPGFGDSRSPAWSSSSSPGRTPGPPSRG